MAVIINTVPLAKAEKQSGRKTPLKTVETNDFKEMYKMYVSGGMYGNLQYADLALLLKNKKVLFK